MLSETNLTPYGLMKALTNIDNKTNETIEDITDKMGKKAKDSDKEDTKRTTQCKTKQETMGQKESRVSI